MTEVSIDCANPRATLIDQTRVQSFVSWDGALRCPFVSITALKCLSSVAGPTSTYSHLQIIKKSPFNHRTIRDPQWRFQVGRTDTKISPIHRTVQCHPQPRELVRPPE